MSLIEKTTESLSSNDKVIHYLHGSTNNSLKILEKTSSENLFSIQQHRPRSSSEYDSLSSSSSSIIDSLSRSDGSLESSLSDPIAHGCIISSSNTSPDEDLDFNIGFEQINDLDDEQHIFNKNNADALALLGTSMVDEYLRQSSNSTVFNDEYEFINDDTLTEYYNKQHRRASFLHDSTHTLCSPDPFSVYTEDNQDNEQTIGFPIRSHSLTIFPIDDQSTFVEKAPKKMVRFADMMGLDLESIRYMTPPDQTTTTSILQECVRLQLGQLRISKNQLDIPDIRKRTSSTTSLPSPTRHYNLVSKNFTSPINITPLIYEKQVLLECLYTKDALAYGTIRVHNCAYNKYVFVRLTQDEWETSNDIQASHSMNYTHDNTDAFAFQITLSKTIDIIEGSKRILFAVCLQANGQEFWDNNQGWNYVLDVFERR